MANNREGIFSLFEVRRRQLSSVWENSSRLFYYDSSEGIKVGTAIRVSDNSQLGTNPVGYVKGNGYSRLYFTNDHAQLITRISGHPASSSEDNSSFNALESVVSSASAGYIFTAQNLFPTIPSTEHALKKHSYANDTVVTNILVPTGSAAHFGGTGVSNTSYGWFAGGGPADVAHASGSPVTYNLRSSMMYRRFWNPVISADSFGFSSIRRLDFSNDSYDVNVRSNLSPRFYLSSTNNANYGWFSGGMVNNRNESLDGVPYTVDKVLLLADGSNSAQKQTVLAIEKPQLLLSIIERLDYSNDIVSAAFKSNLNRPLTGHTGVGNNNYGWYYGGASTNYGGFPIDSIHDGYSPGAVLPFSDQTRCVSSVERMDYANDTVTPLPRAPFNYSAVKSAGMSNYKDFGYFAGGRGRQHLLTHRGTFKFPVNSNPPGIQWSMSDDEALSIVSRLDFANDTGMSLFRTNISSATPSGFAHGYTGTSSWLGFADSPDYIEAEEALRKPREVFPPGYTHVASLNKIWFATTQDAPSGPGTKVLENYDVSTDTMTSSSQVAYVNSGISFYGPSQYRNRELDNNVSVSSKSKGYLTFSNGQNLYELDYSNNTLNISKVCLSLARTNSVGNQNYAWFSGILGLTNAYWGKNTVPYQPATYGLGAVAHPNTGIFSAKDASEPSDASEPYYELSGIHPSSTEPPAAKRTSSNILVHAHYASVTSIDRLDYSSSDLRTSPKGNLNTHRSFSGELSVHNYGYFLGGLFLRNNHNLAQSPSAYSFTFSEDPSTYYSSTERIDYANDTATTSLRANLPAVRAFMGSSGNTTYGWLYGGSGSYINTLTVSSVLRFDYANDTTGLNTRGPLNHSRECMGASGNSTHGYIHGGRHRHANLTSFDPPTEHEKTFGKHSGADNASYYNTDINNLNIPVPSQYFLKTLKYNYANDTVTQTPTSSLSTSIDIEYSQGTFTTGFSYLEPHLSVTPPASPSPSGTTVQSGTPFPVSSKAFIFHRTDYAQNDSSRRLYNIFEMAAGWCKLSTTTGLPVSPVGCVGNKNHCWIFGSVLSPSATQPTMPGSVGGAWPGSLSRTDGGDVVRLSYNNNTTWAMWRAKSIAYNTNNPFQLAHYVSSDSGFSGNHDAGWITGGNPSSPAGGFRKIYKLDYSNDVRTLSRGSIITTRNQHGQCGNLNYAWLTGGYVTTPTTPTRTSNIERLDYANDSTTSNRGTGPICFNHLATGNANYGWIYAAGSIPGEFLSFNIARIDYTNDNVSASTRIPGYAFSSTQRTNGFSNASYAWVHAFTAFNNSSYFRHNFSNDTASLEYHFPPPGAHQSGIKFDIGWGPGQSNYSKIATSQASQMVYHKYFLEIP